MVDLHAKNCYRDEKRFSFNTDVIIDIDVVFLKIFDKEKWKSLSFKYSNIIYDEEQRK